MKSRRVTYDSQVAADLNAILGWLADIAGPPTAMDIVFDIETFMARLDIAAERGTLRDDIRPGIRIVGHRRAVIAFVVDAETVTVLRVFYGGQDWESLLS